MPTLPPGTEVLIRAEYLRRLSFPPPARASLLIGVHEAALRAPESPATQLLGFSDGDLSWAGALSERHLEVESESAGDPRQLLAEAVAAGPRLWEIVWPGELLRDPEHGPLGTVYQRERPWVVVGSTAAGDLLAAPLNEASNPQWYTPVLAEGDMLMDRSRKDAQLELAHLWTFPESLGAIGTVASAAHEGLLEALRRYF